MYRTFRDARLGRLLPAWGFALIRLRFRRTLRHWAETRPREGVAVRCGDSPTGSELEADARTLGICARSTVGKDERCASPCPGDRVALVHDRIRCSRQGRRG